jgi:hypothetical protein
MHAKNTAPRRSWWYVAYFLSIIFRRQKWIRLKIRNLGAISDHIDWIQVNFCKETSPNFFATKEKLWKYIYDLEFIPKAMSQPKTIPQFRVYEFGVAHGYTPFYWQKNFLKSISRWTGFDSFVGLPRSWRGKDVGAFSNQGQIPHFTDSRFQFIKGMIEDTLLDFKFEREDGETLLVFFDLDIFEPTLFAFNKLSAFLKQNDILYFDESFDIDERFIIQHHLLKTFDITLLGYTALSTAFRINEKNA